MLTDYRRHDLDKMLNIAQVKEKAKEADHGEDSYPFALGWVEGQQERAIEIAKEALDEVDRLNAQLRDAEEIAQELYSEAELQDAWNVYYAKHYPED
jgi:hypothetical protein